VIILFYGCIGTKKNETTLDFNRKARNYDKT
jgi:hypothetical protein